MRCEDDHDAGTFAARVLAWLERDPVRDNTIYTVISAKADGSMPSASGDRWIRVVDGDHLVGAACWTPPHGVLLATMPPPAALAVADHLRAARPPAVSGPAALADAFADRHTDATGRGRALGLDMAVFRLDEVTPPPGGAPGGRLREARPEDRDLLLDWYGRFIREAVPHQAGTDPAPLVDSRLADRRGLWLWEDGEPVTLVGTAPPAAGVVRIVPVYTPPDRRGHGYASIAVAAVCQAMLDAGAHAITLNTDLANPTSNRIYQRIGFRRVGAAREWRFTG